MEACAFVNGEVKEVNSGSGVLVCEPKVWVKGIEASEKSSKFMCSAWPNEKNVVYIARDK